MRVEILLLTTYHYGTELCYINLNQRTLVTHTYHQAFNSCIKYAKGILHTMKTRKNNISLILNVQIAISLSVIASSNADELNV